MKEKLPKNILGIYLSDSTIEVVEIELNRNKIKLKAQKKIDLEPGIIEKGKILDRNKLINILDQIVASPDKGTFSLNNVVLSLPSSWGYELNFEIETNKNVDTLEQEIINKVKNLAPVLLKDSYYIYYQTEEKANKSNFNFFSVSNTIINDYQQAFSQAGLKIKQITNDFISISKVTSTLFKSVAQKPIFLVNIYNENTFLSLLNYGLVIKTIDLAVGKENFIQSISQKLNLSRQNAIEYAKNFGISRPPHKITVFKSLEELLQSFLDQLKTEIQHMVKEYDLETGTLLFIEENHPILGLKDYIAKQLNLELISLMVTGPGNKPVELSNLSKAIGPTIFYFEKDLPQQTFNLIHTVKAEEVVKKEKSKKFSFFSIFKRKEKRTEEVVSTTKEQEKLEPTAITERPKEKILNTTTSGRNVPKPLPHEDLTKNKKSFSVTPKHILHQFATNSKFQIFCVTILILAILFPFSIWGVITLLSDGKGEPNIVSNNSQMRDQINVDKVITIDFNGQSSDDFAISGTLLNKDFQLSKDFSSSGSKEQSITNQITIYNYSDNVVQLLEDFALVSEKGHIYYLDQDVTIPKKQQANSTVTPKLETYKLSDETRLDFSILNDQTQQWIYALPLEESENITVKYITAEDIANAESSLTQEIRSSVLNPQNFTIESGEKLLPVIVKQSTKSSSSDKPADTEAESFNYTLVLTISVVKVEQANLDNLFNSISSSNLNENEDISKYEIEQISYSEVTLNADESSATIKLSYVLKKK